MALDKAEVKRIARLARIRIPDEELDGLAGELSAILGWIETLNEVDVRGVEPMAGVARRRIVDARRCGHRRRRRGSYPRQPRRRRTKTISSCLKVVE